MERGREAGEARPDWSTRFASALFFGVVACGLIGLALAQLGCFRGGLVLAIGAGAGVVGWRAAASMPNLGRGEGIGVFVAALALYLPGYDATLYGSDATVYLAAGAHLARSGELGAEDAVLERLPARARVRLFPAYGYEADAPRARSIGGLVFDPSRLRVHSTFSALPSVLLAVGETAAGRAGALAVTPILAATGLLLLYLLFAATVGRLVGLTSAALLALSPPEVLFARLPMGEIVAQAGLLGACFFAAQAAGTSRRLLPVGLGLGFAALARPEYVAFVPLVLAVHWASARQAPRAAAPAALLALALTVWAACSALLLTPSHYRMALGHLWHGIGLIGQEVARWPWVLSALALSLVGVVALLRRAGWRPEPRSVLRAVVLGGAALGLLGSLPWVASPASGKVLSWLPLYAGWPVLLLAPLGAPPLVRALWRAPGTRLFVLLAAVSGAVFLLDPRTAASPIWTSRRLLPTFLPFLFAAAAYAVVGSRRVLRAAPPVLAAAALLTLLDASRPLLSPHLLRGGQDLVDRIAAALPEDALVLLDPALKPSLLDVPLLLEHERHVLPLPGVAGATRPAEELHALLPDWPLLLVRPTLLSAPRAEGLRFEPSARVSGHVLLPGAERSTQLDVTVYRVERVDPVVTGPASRR